jgi:15-cis-phytoene synthase
MEPVGEAASRRLLIEASLEYCEGYLRLVSTSFHLGMRLAPLEKRQALYVLYRWMHEADNVADNFDWDDHAEDPDGPGQTWREEARARLEHFWQQTLTAASRRDELWPALTMTLEKYPIDRAWLRTLIDGMVADTSHTPPRTFAELDTYCHQAAGTVGMCCVAIFGVRRQEDRAKALHLGERLGRAFQMTNIMRDVLADHHFLSPRCYVPTELLEECSLTRETLVAWEDPVMCEKAMRAMMAHADALYGSERELMALIEPESRAALWAMSARYRAILSALRSNPRLCVTLPVYRPSRFSKATIAARAIARRLVSI